MPLSFMIVNTGRAASRAFAINLFSQPNVLTIPRYSFDKVVTSFIANDDPFPLEQLGQTINSIRQSAVRDLPLGIVFHGMRPRLAKPFDDERNIRFLSAVRDQLSIRSVFLVVRNAEALALSELNRRLAMAEGDWKFRDGQLNWQKSYSLADMKRLSGSVGSAKSAALRPADVDINKISRQLSQTTGRFSSIWRGFSQVFPNVYVVPYERFVKDPDETMQAIGEKAGVLLHPNELAALKLNSLGNRFMIYNEIKLTLPQNGDSSQPTTSYNETLRNNRPAFVRFRFEIKGAINNCFDWGEYIPTDVNCSDYFEDIEKSFGAPIRLGINVNDIQALTPDLRAVLHQAAFLSEFLATFGPIFRENYSFYMNYYKEHIYLKELPESVKDIFYAKNGSEIGLFNEMRKQGKVKSVFDG